MGGGAKEERRFRLSAAGRSPRGRRSHTSRRRQQQAGGSISAWAEEPPTAAVAARSRGVDLRVGGGALGDRQGLGGMRGRSPRGRRSPFGTRQRTPWIGSISAWAEEPQSASLDVLRKWVDLRVGGGAHASGASTRPTRGRSPRGRRSPIRSRRRPGSRRSISAWAEEPRHHPLNRHQRRVDLRVGGGALMLRQERSA